VSWDVGELRRRRYCLWRGGHIGVGRRRGRGVGRAVLGGELGMCRVGSGLSGLEEEQVLVDGGWI
jgi:hypothetical protein